MCAEGGEERRGIDEQHRARRRGQLHAEIDRHELGAEQGRDEQPRAGGGGIAEGGTQPRHAAAPADPQAAQHRRAGRAQRRLQQRRQALLHGHLHGHLLHAPQRAQYGDRGNRQRIQPVASRHACVLPPQCCVSCGARAIGIGAGPGCIGAPGRNWHAARARGG
jgi:hypothetical protein